GRAEADATRALRRATHQTIRAATEELEHFRFNTLISRLMEHTTAMQRARDAGTVDPAAWDEAVKTAVLLTAPLAPHIAEELWEQLGQGYSVHLHAWPEFDPDLAHEDEVELVVQVNGKVRERLLLRSDCSEDEARAAAFASPKVGEWLAGRDPRRVVYVPGKLLNIVV
ncbi:MAG TPA: class I tRNA ligase family protein, partial [Tepidiformaceae bacterium]|nr:class I tRNA ligase family protein [Tepidiformaceae bacterium]